MRLEHFGLHEQPFGTTPDPRFLYFSAAHAEALAALHYGLNQRRGLLVLIAPSGMGKTTLLHHLLERWKGRAEAAFVFHPPETREQMLAAVLEDLGRPSNGDSAEARRLLHVLALDCYRRGKRLLLVFDEAQNIPPAVLEEIRLLSNFETSKEKLIEVILAGQPGLAERLRAPEQEQLRQRIGVWAEIGPLDRGEVRRYVEHRLRTAGCERPRLFTRAALGLLAQRSQGIPRSINALCFEGLSSAFAEGKKRVAEEHIPQMPPQLTSSEARRKRPLLRLRWVTAAATVILGAGVLLAGAYLQHSGRLALSSWQAFRVMGGSSR